MTKKGTNIVFTSKRTYSDFKRVAKRINVDKAKALTEAMEMWVEKNKRGYSKKNCIPNEIQEKNETSEKQGAEDKTISSKDKLRSSK